MLKTKSEISILKPGAVLPSDTQLRVVHGKITRVENSFEEFMEGVTVTYSYFVLDVINGGDKEEYREVTIASGLKTFSFEEAQAIKDTLTIPEGLSEKDEILYKYSEALRMKMAERFLVDVKDIIGT